MSYFLNSIDKWHKRICEGGLFLGMALLSCMTLAVLLQVFMRYIFNNPISWIEEFSVYCMFLMVFLLLPYIALHQLNISMTLFYDKISQPTPRLILDIFIQVISCYGIIAITPVLLEVIVNNWTVTTTQMPLSKGQFYAVVPLSFFFVITITVQNIIRSTIQHFHPKREGEER